MGGHMDKPMVGPFVDEVEVILLIHAVDEVYKDVMRSAKHFAPVSRGNLTLLESELHELSEPCLRKIFHVAHHEVFKNLSIAIAYEGIKEVCDGKEFGPSHEPTGLRSK